MDPQIGWNEKFDTWKNLVQKIVPQINSDRKIDPQIDYDKKKQNYVSIQSKNKSTDWSGSMPK